MGLCGESLEDESGLHGPKYAEFDTKLARSPHREEARSAFNTGRERRLSGSSPAAGRCHRGNSHSAEPAPDYGPEPGTGRGAPSIAPANR